MPERPDRREDQTRDQWRMVFLQTRKREPTPARFFAEPDEEKDEDESLRQFAQRRGRRQRNSLAERDHDADGDRTKQNRQAEDDRVGRPADASADDPAEQRAQAGTALGESGHQQCRDEWSEGIWTRSRSANERDNPRIPGKQKGEDEEEREIVPGDQLAEFARANSRNRDRLNR